MILKPTIFGLTITSIMAGGTIAAAEETSEPDVSWESYTTSVACIEKHVSEILEKYVDITVSDRAVRGVQYFESTINDDPKLVESSFTVNFQDAPDDGLSVLVESLTHVFNHKWESNDEFNLKRYGYSNRVGVLAYAPLALSNTVFANLDNVESAQIRTQFLKNGEFGVYGRGESDYDAESVLRDLDARIRSCNPAALLSM